MIKRRGNSPIENSSSLYHQSVMSSKYQRLPGSPNVDFEGQTIENKIRRTIGKRLLLFPAALLLIFLIRFLFTSSRHSRIGKRDIVELKFASGKVIPDASVAYATLLTGQDDKVDERPANEDHYYVSARMLCYQLLHQERTKTSLGAPCLVLTTPNVRQDKIEQLKQDGATVVPVDYITSDWATTEVETWQYVLSKIHLWQMTKYDLIAFLDTDRVLLESLDGLFSDPAIVVQENKQEDSAIRADEGPQPEEYLFASTAEMTKNHSFPPKTEPEDFYNVHYFEAGTVVLRPSLEMYNYHMKVLSIPNRFPPALPEQNMWNYIYRHDGNMPWVQLDTSWSAHFPTLKDIQMGAKSVHEKFWFPTNQEIQPLLLAARQKMFDFYDERKKDKLRKHSGKILSIRSLVRR